MIQAINIIRETPSNNLNIAKFMIEEMLNSDQISYPEYMELEMLIELYK